MKLSKKARTCGNSLSNLSRETAPILIPKKHSSSTLFLKSLSRKAEYLSRELDKEDQRSEKLADKTTQVSTEVSVFLNLLYHYLFNSKIFYLS